MSYVVDEVVSKWCVAYDVICKACAVDEVTAPT